MPQHSPRRLAVLARGLASRLGSRSPLPLPGAHLRHAAAQVVLMSVRRDDSPGREAWVQEVNHGEPRRRGVEERAAVERARIPREVVSTGTGKQLNSARSAGRHSALLRKVWAFVKHSSAADPAPRTAFPTHTGPTTPPRLEGPTALLPPF